MSSHAAELAARLSRHAEHVCRRYLSRGRKSGRYWLVGDAAGMPGRSLYVRLHGPDRGPLAAGKWTDAATGEHGDLIDIIRLACGFSSLAGALAEARAFLCDPAPAPSHSSQGERTPASRTRAARRLFAMGRPIPGTLAELYLRTRAIRDPLDYAALRFHPSCFHRASEHAPLTNWPALLAAVTDLSGTLTGVHRTWLAADGLSKAPLDDPRRALGALQGHAVRFGRPDSVLITGEGLETMLSLRCLLPFLPAAAALSAGNLPLLILPPGLQRLYIASDNDPAGRRAAARLAVSAQASAVDPLFLIPALGDWNADLRENGFERTLTLARSQLHPDDDRVLPG